MADLQTTDLVVVGANHRSSALALRDRLFVDDAGMPDALAQLRQAGVDQALLLSTCDRVEVQTVSRRPDQAFDAIGRFMAERARVERPALVSQLYRHTGVDAVRHVFAVACSLDSLIIGEPQVLGQVKASHRMAQAAGMVGPALNAVLSAAYGAAKRVRSETAIGERPVSIAAAAVQLARDVHGDLSRCGGLLVGLGEMGEMMVRQLLAAGLAQLTVTAPSATRAETAAREHAGHHADFERLADCLTEADIVVSALGSGSRVIEPETMEAALRRRRRRPVFLIDAAIPGDLAPAINDLDGAFLYDLDDLERVAMLGRASREAAAEAAWSIVDEEVDAWSRRQAEQAAVPVVRALRAHFEQVRQDVLRGTTDPAEATRMLVSRLLHDPLQTLRQIAAGEDAERAEQLVRRLFRLDPDDRPGSGEENGE